MVCVDGKGFVLLHTYINVTDADETITTNRIGCVGANDGAGGLLN